MGSETAIVLVASAGFVGLLGVLIKYFGRVELIAGYDPERVADETGLADFIGTNALYVAALLFLVAVAEYAEPFGGDGADLVWLAFTVGVLGLAVRMIRGARRYEIDS
ncbi:hypothetical protein [Halopiger xanaduensis]|uniref:DUF3784 domain-containing protein n=1 Tax=Halopiger xanaduensis (strain DSM 18323 / JCM 14033 / SH-6) TaxID=797210 RepID=F8D3J9_HALXS|nr:hypothetical protein [Halopiger xanaduensis]AEH37364.1 hypothetical protein Halxa_2748 [Halopiger xanaduensis SH-6]